MAIQIGEDGIKRRIEEIGKLRQSISRIEKLKELADHTAWIHFKGIINDNIEARERMIRAIQLGEKDAASAEDLRLDIRENISILNTFRSMIRLVERPEDEIAVYQSQIAKKEIEIKEAKELGA
jgi:hypothetical protein